MVTHPCPPARCRFFVSLLLALPLSCPALPASEFFVATNGRDDAAGTRQDPFATFARAQQAVRQRLREDPQQGVTVRIAAGRYELSEPLMFGPEDGGPRADAPVRYQAEVDGQVIVSGGRRIGDWQPADPQLGLWKARVVRAPAAADRSWRFEQLWVNGRRAVRARAPNSWQFHLLAANVLEEETDQRGRYQHTFLARPGDLRELAELSPQQLQDVQVLVFHKWDTTREWIQTAKVDSAGGGSFTTLGGKMKSWNGMTRDCLYFFENFRDALDAPGEWFLARDGWLYYYPLPGEDMQTAEVFAPRIDALLAVQGQVDDSQQWVQNLHFQGLHFRHAEFRIPAAGQPPHQAAMSVSDAAILVNGAQNVSFDACAVEHIGTTAFWFREACRNCRVTRTRMFDLGITGVRIGQEQLVPEPVRTGQITIDNCIIHSGGRIMPCAVGVWIGHSADNALTHCDVADFFYTAVSVGWRWGYGESGAQRNRVEFNHLHHIGYRILSDMGGVYTLGPSPGTSVSHNVIHDVYSTRYGGWGLYPDEGSTGILFENNLVYDVRDGCFHQHYGKENVVRNNILAFSEEGQIAVTRAEPHLSFTFERNLVYWDEGRLLGYNGWNAGAQVKLQNNLYWRAGGQPFDFAGKSWEQWRAAGHDAGSIIADPLFVDAARRDFRLQTGSPAQQIGFVPFDFSQAGVYGSEDWQQLARSTKFPEPYVVPQAEPLSLRDDFEQPQLSMLLNLATVRTEDRPELVRVTQQQAARGRWCLQVQDDPTLKAGYDPHFYVAPNYTQGPAELRFQIRLEPGAAAHCEWRSKGHPYRVGPSLLFRDGALFARNKQLMQIPTDAWIGIRMATTVGPEGNHWTLTVTSPSGAPQQFDDLPCDPDWTEAQWVGFSSNSRDKASFYLDDVALTGR